MRDGSAWGLELELEPEPDLSGVLGNPSRPARPLLASESSKED